MNCQDFLPNLETGGFLRRFAARRHAARCPRCADVLKHFAAAKQALASVAPLSAEQLQRWTDVCALDAPSPARLSPAWPTKRRWAIAGACAGIAAAAVTLAVFLGEDGPEKGNPIGGRRTDESTETFQVVETAEEFVRLEDSLAHLDADLKQMALDVDRMQARQLASDLLRQYDKQSLVP